jgi:hypothetical protein
VEKERGRPSRNRSVGVAAWFLLVHTLGTASGDGSTAGWRPKSPKQLLEKDGMTYPRKILISIDRPLVLAVIVLVMAAIAIGSLGCNGSEEAVAPDASVPDDNATCEDLLTSIFDMLVPDRLGVSAEAADAVSLLNQWQDCTAFSMPDTHSGETLSRLLETVLPADQLDQALGARFVERDAEHMRTCLLALETADFAIADAQNDLDRVVNVFNYVVRNIELIDRGESTIPLTLYQAVLLGQGTASDRAWFFAEILRQMRVDTVILQPPSAAPVNGSSPEERAWLVGVLLERDVYLFDTRLGWPVPAGGEEAAATVRRPATLAEVLEDDALLRQLDVDTDHPYPLTAAELATARVGVVGNTGHWLPRLEMLQSALAGVSTVVIHDGLGDPDSENGLQRRVAEVTGEILQPVDISIWPYPEQQLAGASNLEEAQSEHLSKLLSPFGAPVTFRVDMVAKEVFVGTPERTQLKTRLSQMTGEFDAAIRSYITLRLGKNRLPRSFEGPEEIVREVAEVHRIDQQAAEDAFFWIGASQFELGSVEAAIETCKDYLQARQAGIAFIVHPENQLDAVSIEELRRVYQRQTTNWSRLGGESGRIHIMGIKTRGPALSIFVRGILQGNIRANVRARDKQTTAEVIEAVAGDKLAIGFVDLYKLSPGERRVKLLNLKEPDAEPSHPRNSPTYPFRFSRGRWISSARYLAAISFASMEKLDEAAVTLEQIEPSHPQHDGFKLLVRRWRAPHAAEVAEAKENATEKEEPSATTEPSTTKPDVEQE